MSIRGQRRRGIRAASALLGVALLAAAGRAAAEPARPAKLSLRWAAPEGCMEGPTLARLVDETLGRTVFVGEAGADARLEGEMTPAPGGYHVRLEVRRSAGAEPLGARELELTGADCRSLDASIAIVAAVLADAVPVVPDAPPPPPAPLRLQAPPPRARLGAFLGVEGGVTLGLLPRAAPWLGAAAWIAPGDVLELAIAPRMWLPQTALVGGHGGRFSAWTIAVEGCGRLVERRRLGVTLCGRAEGGSLLAVPVGLEGGSDAARGLWLAGASFRAGTRVVGPVWAELAADVEAPLLRPTFYFVDRAGERRDVSRPAVIVGGFGLRAGVHFGDGGS